jgi:hypothetical protein
LSTLTKVFVVLLVVLSLLLTAGTITFVNAVGNQRTALENSRQERANAESHAQRLQQELSAMELRVRDAEKTSAQVIENSKQAANQAQQLVADRDTRNAELAARLSMANADVTRLTEALRASEQTKSSALTTLEQERKSYADAMTQAAQMNQSINELTNRLDVTERERRFLAEQLEEQRNNNTKLQGAVQQMGGNLQQILAGPGPTRGPGVPPINAVVRDVKDMAGKKYATISVGASDNVTRGMEFKLVDRNTGNFLGVLTVTAIEPNEAIGVVEGPKVNDIHPGVEARTQL